MMDTLELTDGTTTIDFTGTAYSVTDWPVRLPMMREGENGRQFEPVDERASLHITGSSNSDLLSKTSTLYLLLRQALLWGIGGDVAPVLWKYRPYAGSSAGELSSVVYKPYKDDITNDVLELPGDFTLAPATLNTPAAMAWRRTPLWLGSTQTRSAASGGNAHPTFIMSSNFSDTAAFPWPFDLNITVSGAGVALTGSHTVLIATQNASDMMDKNHVASWTRGSAVSSTAVTGSSSGSVARFDPTGANANLYIEDPLGGFATDVRNLAVYIVVRNNSASNVSWDIYAQYLADETAVNGRAYRITAGDNDRKILPLGILSGAAPVTDVRIYAEPVGSGTSGDELDLDTLAVVAVDENMNEVYFPAWDFGSNTGNAGAFIEHRTLTHRTPIAYLEDGIGTSLAYPGYKGSAYLASGGNQLAVLIMALNSDGSQWYSHDGGAGSNVINFLPEAVRQLAYLVPE